MKTVLTISAIAVVAGIAGYYAAKFVADAQDTWLDDGRGPIDPHLPDEVWLS